MPFYSRPSASPKPHNKKPNEYNLSLCTGFIDYEKAFATVEQFATFEALIKTNINETYVTIKKKSTAKLQQGST